LIQSVTYAEASDKSFLLVSLVSFELVIARVQNMSSLSGSAYVRYGLSDKGQVASALRTAALSPIQRSLLTKQYPTSQGQQLTLQPHGRDH